MQNIFCDSQCDYFQVDHPIYNILEFKVQQYLLEQIHLPKKPTQTAAVKKDCHRTPKVIILLARQFKMNCTIVPFISKLREETYAIGVRCKKSLSTLLFCPKIQFFK